jgi:hypothetical protein
MCRYLLILLALVLSGCRSAPPPNINPDIKAAQTLREAENDDLLRSRLEVRNLAVGFLKQAAPQWEIKGVSFYRYSGSDYNVTADLSQGEQRESVNFSIRLFTNDKGEMYWKTVNNKPKDVEEKVSLSGYLTAPHPPKSGSDKEVEKDAER